MNTRGFSDSQVIVQLIDWWRETRRLNEAGTSGAQQRPWETGVYFRHRFYHQPDFLEETGPSMVQRTRR